LSGGQHSNCIGSALWHSIRKFSFSTNPPSIQPNIVREIGDILLRLNREEKTHRAAGGTKVTFARLWVVSFASWIAAGGRRSGHEQLTTTNSPLFNGIA